MPIFIGMPIFIAKTWGQNEVKRVNILFQVRSSGHGAFAASVKWSRRGIKVKILSADLELA